MAKRSSSEDKRARQFLETYLATPAPVGDEVKGQEVWSEYISSFMDAKNDDHFEPLPYGSLVAVIPGTNPDFKVSIEAHADEISWRIMNINNPYNMANHGPGTLGVAQNGGADPRVAVGSRVNIYTKKGIVKGVFGHAAIHTRPSVDEEVQQNYELFIDIGANSAEEAAKRVEIGDLVLFQDSMMEIGAKNEYITGRALDDRICGYVNTQVLRRLKERKEKLPYTLYVINSVQEETSFRGAKEAALNIRPDVSINLDVAHDTQTYGYDVNKQGELFLDKGPIVSFSTASHRKTRDLILDTAKKNKIPVQRDASDDGSFPGTNTDTFSDNGAAAALISVPLRYMHTAIEMVSKKDLRATEKLVVKTLQNITGEKSQFDLFAHKRKIWEKKFPGPKSL